MRFYLGVHRGNWFGRTNVPLFVSHRVLRDRHTFHRARGPWALDSGGFTELNLHGKWTVTEEEYIRAVELYRQEIGNLEWASPQDWMCEPFVLDKTGLSLEEHQIRTVHNYLTLRDKADHLPFIPVLQGWALDDYRRCVELYEHHGVDLGEEPTVGVGSVCRRQSTEEIHDIMRSLSQDGLRLHGFGVKTRGLERYGPLLASADSMAWSFDARYSDPLSGCEHRQCQNCLRYALQWRRQVLDRVEAA